MRFAKAYGSVSHNSKTSNNNGNEIIEQFKKSIIVIHHEI